MPGDQTLRRRAVEVGDRDEPVRCDRHFQQAVDQEWGASSGPENENLFHDSLPVGL